MINAQLTASMTVLEMVQTSQEGETIYVEGKALFEENPIKIYAYGTRGASLMETVGKEIVATCEITGGSRNPSLKVTDFQALEVSASSDSEALSLATDQAASLEADNQELRGKSTQAVELITTLLGNKSLSKIKKDELTNSY